MKRPSKKIALFSLVPAVLALAGWGGVRLMHRASAPDATGIPVAAVQRGDVTFAVTAKGELVGGNSEMLSAPMIGGAPMTITFLRESGELVKAGDVVVKYDTTEQEFKLKEAQADLAEAEQQVQQAQAESQAK